MKKLVILLLSFICFYSLSSTAQQKTLQKVLELKIPREGGANGASVTWHPAQKKYYAAMAGNSSFCMGVFDVKGKLVSPAEQQTLFDVRGLWYNPNTKKLQANGYNDFGWAEYVLDTKGFPSEITKLYDGLHQPDEQSAGTYNPKENVLYFFNSDGNLDVYNFSNGEYKDNIDIFLGSDIKDSADADISDNYDALENYNSSTVVYTGIKGFEIGLFNYFDNTIELYNIKNGYLSKKMSLPENAPAPDFLNFSYCNGIYWFFDKETRTWMGYK